jgi:hypothetical protein
MIIPYQNTATARLIDDRIRDLAHKKTQAEIASKAGFLNANMITFLKNGRNKFPWTECIRLRRHSRSIRPI